MQSACIRHNQHVCVLAHSEAAEAEHAALAAALAVALAASLAASEPTAAKLNALVASLAAF